MVLSVSFRRPHQEFDFSQIYGQGCYKNNQKSICNFLFRLLKPEGHFDAVSLCTLTQFCRKFLFYCKVPNLLRIGLFTQNTWGGRLYFEHIIFLNLFLSFWPYQRRLLMVAQSCKILKVQKFSFCKELSFLEIS